jgi:glycosyltransferase involved in cell wall biosynthesis
VVTVSETARREIIQMFGIEERRITNTYQAVAIPKSLMDRPMDEVGADLESIFNLRLRKYFLFFGAIEPKKNLPRLIEAYLSSNVRDPLVIVGGQGWLAEQETALLYDDLLEARVLSEGLWRRADRIRRYDYLPQALLVSLVRGAKAVMFPSLYEGFGLPLLEAMQLGTPVVASTGGALPEIAGDAAVLVDPFDVTAIKRAIFEVGSDEGLCATLSERGRARAGEFSASAYEARLGRLYGAFI